MPSRLELLIYFALRHAQQSMHSSYYLLSSSRGRCIFLSRITQRYLLCEQRHWGDIDHSAAKHEIDFLMFVPNSTTYSCSKPVYCRAVPCRPPTYYLQLTCVLWQVRNCFINVICFVKLDFCLACSAPLYILITVKSHLSNHVNLSYCQWPVEKEQNTHPVCYYC